MDTTTIDTNKDELQKKIDAANAELSQQTRGAINAVNWKSAILSIKEKKGYSLEQLGELETEVELLLCGLTNPENFPNELETRMKISKADTETLVNEMNESIFKKIRDELMKNEQTETKIAEDKKNTDILKSAQIEIIPTSPSISPDIGILEKSETSTDILSKIENPELINNPVSSISQDGKIEDKKIQSISAQKLSGSFQIPTVKTEYSLNNISKQGAPVNSNPVPILTDTSPVKPKIDPYREIPE